ncbi:MAG: hypothetical protein QM741_11700 [Rudaea sp.]|uniref:hypothetical protein n=1 Tax=Rudaea sp. TaxID=2136325 RepID=UPI0039E220A8
MNISKRGFRAMAFGLVAVAGLAFASAASARDHFSLGINLPGLSLGIGSHHTYLGIGGGYYAPGYYAPAYYAAPAPVYYDPYPAYYGPAYYGGYYARPVVYRGGYYGHGYYRDGYRGGYHGSYHGGGYYHR